MATMMPATPRTIRIETAPINSALTASFATGRNLGVGTRSENENNIDLQA